MNKRILCAITGISIVLGGLNSLSAFAEDIEPRTTSNYNDQIETTSDEIPVTNCLGSDSEIPENCTTPIDQELEDGTSDEPLVVCADENETDCIPEVEDDTEPALWPMIVSMAALGLAAVMIIVLNLTGPKIK